MDQVPTTGRVTVVVLVDVAPEGVAAFRAYEALVLPMLVRHGGALERRLRGAGGLVEVHLIGFPDAAAYAAFLGDPERGVHRRLLQGVELEQRVIEVVDVPRSESGLG